MFRKKLTQEQIEKKFKRELDVVASMNSFYDEEKVEAMLQGFGMGFGSVLLEYQDELDPISLSSLTTRMVKEKVKEMKIDRLAENSDEIIKKCVKKK